MAALKPVAVGEEEKFLVCMFIAPDPELPNNSVRLGAETPLPSSLRNSDKGMVTVRHPFVAKGKAAPLASFQGS